MLRKQLALLGLPLTPFQWGCLEHPAQSQPEMTLWSQLLSYEMLHLSDVRIGPTRFDEAMPTCRSHIELDRWPLQRSSRIQTSCLQQWVKRAVLLLHVHSWMMMKYDEWMRCTLMWWLWQANPQQWHDLFSHVLSMDTTSLQIDRSCTKGGITLTQSFEETLLQRLLPAYQTNEIQWGNDATWCNMMQHDATWCNMMQLMSGSNSSDSSARLTRAISRRQWLK